MSSCSDIISSGRLEQTPPQKKQWKFTVTETEAILQEELSPHSSCVLSVPHLDDHKPHEDAAAAEVTCEGLRHTSEGGEGLFRADLSDASGGRRVCPGLRQALLLEDVVKGCNACGFWKCYYHHVAF